MGDDFSNRQIFAGDLNPVAMRDLIIREIRAFLGDAGYVEVQSEKDASRSLVIGPARRWIFVGDTAATGGWGQFDGPADQALTLHISRFAPIVAVNMDDSAALHLKLFENGSLVDKFANTLACWKNFESEAQAVEYSGKPERWSHLLSKAAGSSSLREIWRQRFRADQILVATARVFDWHPTLCSLGYTLDLEGLGEKYDEVLGPQDVLGLTELHFLLQPVKAVCEVTWQTEATRKRFEHEETISCLSVRFASEGVTDYQVVEFTKRGQPSANVEPVVYGMELRLVKTELRNLVRAGLRFDVIEDFQAIVNGVMIFVEERQ